MMLGVTVKVKVGVGVKEGVNVAVRVGVHVKVNDGVGVTVGGTGVMVWVTVLVGLTAIWAASVAVDVGVTAFLGNRITRPKITAAVINAIIPKMSGCLYQGTASVLGRVLVSDTGMIRSVVRTGPEGKGAVKKPVGILSRPLMAWSKAFAKAVTVGKRSCGSFDMDRSKTCWSA